MIATINTHEFDLLRRYIEKETGISLAEDKVYLVETRLREIIRNESLDGFMSLYEILASRRNPALNAKVLDAMTTNETLWFRDSSPFEIFRDELLPSYALEIKKGQRKKIRIWSAACSTGQEPYSLAMTFLEAAKVNPALQPGQLEILATDFSDEALAKATLGVYRNMAMSRGMPAGFKEKYFHQVDNGHEVNEELKKRIDFRKFNLQDSFTMMGTFDIILTRYVLIYFTDDFKREVLRKAHGALNPKGILFVGSSESLPENATGYSPVRVGRGTYYQKTEGQVEHQPQASRPSAPPQDLIPVVNSEKMKGQNSQDTGNPTADLEKATEDLAAIFKRLQDMNSKYAD